MIMMIPNRPLSAHLSRAIETVEDAQKQLYRVRMHDVARLIRDVFPHARSIVIDVRNRDVAPEGVQLHSILARYGQVVWSADNRVPESLTSYRTVDEYAWDDVVFHLEHELTSALGAERPQAFWEHYVDEHAESGLFVTRLPTSEEVAAVETLAPGHLTAQLRVLDAQAPQLWLASPVRYPTMSVGGVHITAYLDEFDGTFTVDVGTDDRTAGHDSQGRNTVDVRLNGISLHTPTASSGTSS